MKDLYYSENFQTAVLNGSSRNKCDTAQGCTPSGTSIYFSKFDSYYR